MRRTLVTGLVIAVTAAVLAVTGAALGLPTLWPVLLAAATGLLVGVPRLRHVVAFALGAVLGLVGAALPLVVLPALPVAAAIGIAVIVLLATLIALLSRGRIPLSVQLVGFAAMTGLLEPQVAADPSGFLTFGPLSLAGLLVAAALGLLAAQVATVLGGGVAAGGGAAPGAAAQVGLAGAGTAVAAVVALGLVIAPAAALAQIEGSVTSVQHRQSILVPTASDGTPGDGIVVTQLLVSGEGPVRITLQDQAVGGLRNASSFGSPTITGTTVLHDLDLGSGSTLVRTVADLDRPLPVALAITYELDGEVVTPQELLGRSGALKVTYTLTNLTAESREISFFDGLNRPRSETREVAVPLGGTFETRLDARFTAVRAERATVVAGDGAGNTQVNGGFALFGPSGAPIQSFVWEADVIDAIVPKAAIRIVPVSLRTSPDLRTGVATLETFGGGFQSLATGLGVLGTSVTGLESSLNLESPFSATIYGTLDATADALLAGASGGVASVNANLALLRLQSARTEAGDGFVYGMLPEADVTMVYAFNVAGLGADPGPTLPLRLGIGVLLLAVVALLGRSAGGRQQV